MTAALTVVHPATGEQLDLASQSTEDLVGLIAGIGDLRSRLGEFEGAVSDVLVAAMDRSASWTLRVNGYEVKAPSPTAGTDGYPPDMLEGALQALIAGSVITEDAASKACKRRLVLELAVPWGADPRELAAKVRDATGITVGDVEVEVVSADARTTAVASGITALRKVPGTAEALDGAKVTQPAKPRKATVKAVA